MAADGSEVRDVTRFRPGFNLAPAWSPDGRTIVFVHNDREGTDLYTVGRRGRNLTRLTTSPRIVERAPEWSPDGSRILFSRVRETGMPTDEDLFTIASDGSDLTRLTRSRLGFQGAWAPDGDRIVFVRETRRAGPRLVMGADGKRRDEAHERRAQRVLADLLAGRGEDRPLEVRGSRATCT